MSSSFDVGQVGDDLCRGQAVGDEIHEVGDGNPHARRLPHRDDPRTARREQLAGSHVDRAALDTGSGELLNLRFRDIDWDRQLIQVRPEVAKSKKGRVVPIGTTRLRTLLDWLRVGPNNEPLPDDRLVFLRESGDTVKSFRTAWELTREKAGLSTVCVHDLRSEYASRLVELGVPLRQVRDLLGHCSIIVTERYDRVRLDSLKAAVSRHGRWTALQDSFEIRRSALRSRITRLHPLNDMPGWRNWQTHRT
jgi:integrase